MTDLDRRQRAANRIEALAQLRRRFLELEAENRRLRDGVERIADICRGRDGELSGIFTITHGVLHG